MEPVKLYKVKFLPFEVEVDVPPDMDLLKAAIKARIAIYNDCGGRGLCGKCKLKLLQGKCRKEKELELSSSEGKDYLLACQSYPLSDLVLEVPPESRMLEAEILKGRKFQVEEEWEEAESLVDGLYSLEPLLKKVRLKLARPKEDDNLADLERLRRVLDSQAQLKGLKVPLSLLRKLPAQLRAWDWECLLSYSPDIQEIVSLEPPAERMSNWGLACDIGTTTVVVYLVEMETGKVVSSKADYNAQITFGPDVISRIIFAEDAQGLEELNQAIMGTINNLVTNLLSEKKLKPSEVNALVLTGNTSMLHLALKVPPGYIRRAPYTPGFKSALFFKAQELGVEINPEGVVALMPGVASFVGSDIVSGILASGMNQEEGLCVFIDLGTNGEIVLGNKDWMLSCSTSAGPCFEGGILTCGVRAMKGAIQGFQIRGDEVSLKTIADASAIGICGSGIIEIIAELFRNRIIDKAGEFISGSSSRLRVNKYGEEEFLLLPAEEAGIDSDIVVTQSDIKNLIYSKAAIYIGIQVLLNQVGLKAEEIKKFYIAGGLGTYLDIEKSITIGLFPDIPGEKFHFLGNASIQGARLYLISQEAREKARAISETITNIELSNSYEFMNNYSSALFLPHTDLERFPSVKKLLKK